MKDTIPPRPMSPLMEQLRRGRPSAHYAVVSGPDAGAEPSVEVSKLREVFEGWRDGEYEPVSAMRKIALLIDEAEGTGT